MSEKNFHIGIKAVIVNKGKALVLKDLRFNGYDLPGGRIDSGEGIEVALKRELDEELGLKKFTIGELLHVFERLDYGNKKASLMLIYFKVTAKIAKIKLSKEHSQYQWISKKDLSEISNKGEFRNEGIKTVLGMVLK